MPSYGSKSQFLCCQCRRYQYERPLPPDAGRADITENVAHRVDFNFIEADFSISSLIRCTTRFSSQLSLGMQPYRAGSESCLPGNLLLFQDQFEWNILSHYFSPDFLLPVCGEQFQ